MNQTLITEWFTKYKSELYRYAVNKTRNHEIAEDIVQEVYMAALASPKLHEIKQSRAWLFGILKNKIYAYYQLQEQTVLLESEVNFDNIVWSVDDEFERKEIRKSFIFCLSKLAPKKAQAFREKELREIPKKDPEPASTTEITDSYARVLLHRAKAELKRCLQILGFGKQ